MNQTVIQNSSYLISRNGIFYYSRRIPADIRKRFNKDRVIMSLRTRSQAKALQSSRTLSDRLERYWESLRLELFHSRELGLEKITNLTGAQIIWVESMILKELKDSDFIVKDVTLARVKGCYKMTDDHIAPF